MRSPDSHRHSCLLELDVTRCIVVVLRLLHAFEEQAAFVALEGLGHDSMLTVHVVCCMKSVDCGEPSRAKQSKALPPKQ